MKRSFKFGNGNESWLGEVYMVKNVISQFLLFHLNINLIMQNKLNVFNQEIRPK